METRFMDRRMGFHTWTLQWIRVRIVNSMCRVKVCWNLEFIQIRFIQIKIKIDRLPTRCERGGDRAGT